MSTRLHLSLYFTQFATMRITILALTLSVLLESGLQASTSRSLSGQQATTADATTQDENDLPSLELGKPIERELRGGETHRYRIALTASQYLHLDEYSTSKYAIVMRDVSMVYAIRQETPTGGAERRRTRKTAGLRRSRTEQKRRTVRAAILLDAAAGFSDGAIARSQGVNRNTVARCVQKYLRFGLQAALGELPRSGRPRRISDEAIAWLLQVACQKPKDLGYAQELWTYSRLQAHLRRHAPAAGYAE